jgi:uncharacterized protein YidB (DUF937 family)
MGLLDVLNGMQNGPHGQPAPSNTTGGSGGMSPMTMALLGLLAFKAFKSFTAGQPAPVPSGNPGVNPGGTMGAGPPGSAGTGGGIIGGLGDLLKGPLGGILAGGAAGSIVNGGLSDLLRQFQQAGHGDVAGSWVGNQPNRAISPSDLTQVLDSDQINTLMSQTGLSRDQLLAGLSEQLPQLVNHLTPNGRMPTDDEMSRHI